MNLNSYLSSPGSLSVSQLRARMAELGYVVKNDAQIRQWRIRFRGRRPSPTNCVGLELASGWKMRRQDLRPEDWQEIWPELVGQTYSPERKDDGDDQLPMEGPDHA
ncbi:hypothetical protein [Achromobacter sp. ACM03]|uniref:hypothetical protein n=1 Tax=Achromobacter sp. ACM03 TaxID=2769300 RepID=UPI001CE0E9CE|nr:hypothetical protein [Achromobacter sp. ACM03]